VANPDVACSLHHPGQELLAAKGTLIRQLRPAQKLTGVVSHVMAAIVVLKSANLPSIGSLRTMPCCLSQNCTASKKIPVRLFLSKTCFQSLAARPWCERFLPAPFLARARADDHSCIRVEGPLIAAEVRAFSAPGTVMTDPCLSPHRQWRMTVPSVPAGPDDFSC